MAAGVTVAQFRKIFPEFAEVSNEAIGFEINLGEKKQNRATWGQYWKEAVMLSVAHSLALRFNVAGGAADAGMNNPNAGIGFTTSRSASPSSLSEGSQMPAWMTGDDILDSYYGRTMYGQRYLVLMIEVIPAGAAVISPQVGMR